ncbi:phenylalanine--tRNA ligase subunit beta [Aeropyrum pernix]|uniref:phenylalanine--tRNA ligase subunit beta n=1 Tax=Aeropyrum pernix TaxID=56636 RepID=UPI001037C146|nr:phenylalanine--tRNA ligase subunit beta [Aeropyrum pernix]
MPVIRVRRERLEGLTGLSIGELEELLFRLKCEVEEPEEGVLEVEVNPDRPDMYIGEGIARAVKGIAGVEEGWDPPELADTPLSLRVERVPQRPYIAAAVVYGVNVDELFLEELIQFQEKLHDSLGRRRAKIAIGFHDLAKLPSASVEYRLMTLDTRMKPLGYGGSEMSFREFLLADEKGSLYGGLATKDNSHPFLLSGGEVIAAPPVINSEITRVEPGTRDLFIDVTGTSAELVAKTLDIIVASLAEREGARVGRVRLEGPGAVWASTPLLSEAAARLDPGTVSKALGVNLTPEEAALHLRRMRHNASPAGGLVNVRVPPFRVDILGEVDLVEDIAISIGYEALGPRWPGKFHGGSLRWETHVYRAVKDLLVGLGFTEVLQLVLTSPRLVEAAGFSSVAVEVLNPVQQEYSVLRPTLLITLLQTLRENQHRRKPVKVFEAGSAVYLEDGEPRDEEKLALGVLDEEAGFEDVQAPLYAVLRIMGVDFEVEEASHPVFMEGRTAVVKVGGERLGYIGEVKPEVLEAFGLEYPVAAAEISLEVLARWTSRT